MIRYIRYIFLVSLLSTSITNWSFGQALDHPVFTYKAKFDSTNTSEQLLEKFDSLESNWHCINEKDQYIDNLILQKISDKHSEYLILLKALNLIRLYNSDEAEKLIHTLKEKDFKHFPGSFYFLSARLYNKKMNTSKAVEYYNKAYDIFLGNNEYKCAIHTLNHLLNGYLVINDYESASKTYSQSLLLCERNNYLWGFLHLYRSYGSSIGKYDISQSKEILEKGFKLSSSDSSWWSITLRVEYLRFLLRYENNEEFIKLLDESIKLVENNCFKPYYSILLTFKSHTFTLKNDIESAIIYNKKALEVRKNSGNKVLTGYSYLNLINNYLESGDYLNAKTYLDSAKTNLYDIGNLKAKRNYLHQLIKYFSLEKNNDSLINIYNSLLKINDEYYKEQQLILSRNINLKNELNSRLNEEKYALELSNRRNKLVYLSVISILSIVVIIFLVFRLRNINFQFRNLLRGIRIDKRVLSEYEDEIRQLKDIFKNAPKGFLIIDKMSNIIYYNSSAQKLLNRNIELEIGGSFLNYLPKLFQEKYNKALSDVMQTIESQEISLDSFGTAQNKIVLNISISPMIMGDEIESFLIIVSDITKSEIALESEKQQRRILQALINSVTESILLIDHKFQIKLLNKTAASRFGSSVEELIGRDYLDVLPNSLRDTRKEKLEEVYRYKNAIVFDEDVESYNSTISYYPNINANGDIEFIAEFSQDITERKIASEQINSLRQKVLRSQMNPHFIFNSLNAIQSYVLKNDAVKAVKYLNSFARLIRMILDSSRFDYITLAKEIDILKHYLDLQQLRFGDKFIYKLEIDRHLDTDSLLIPAMLAQPFIENAIEHGLQHLETKGTVKISFIRKQESIIFKVIDNGIGREASMKIQENNKHKNTSLSTQLFKERLYTLNRFSGKKITYNIVDLKDDIGSAKGTMVIINLPLIYKSEINLG